jgi:hypothetical protein
MRRGQTATWEPFKRVTSQLQVVPGAIETKKPDRRSRRRSVGSLDNDGADTVAGNPPPEGFDGGKRQPARSNYAAAPTSTETTSAVIGAAEGNPIGKASILLAVAGDERSALFAALRSSLALLVRLVRLGCFGVKALGLSAPRDQSSFLPALTAPIPLAQTLTTLAGLAASN